MSYDLIKELHDFIDESQRDWDQEDEDALKTPDVDDFHTRNEGQSYAVLRWYDEEDYEKHGPGTGRWQSGVPSIISVEGVELSYKSAEHLIDQLTPSLDDLENLSIYDEAPLKALLDRDDIKNDPYLPWDAELTSPNEEYVTSSFNFQGAESLRAAYGYPTRQEWYNSQIKEPEAALEEDEVEEQFSGLRGMEEESFSDSDIQDIMNMLDVHSIDVIADYYDVEPEKIQQVIDGMKESLVAKPRDGSFKNVHNVEQLQNIANKASKENAPRVAYLAQKRIRELTDSGNYRGDASKLSVAGINEGMTWDDARQAADRYWNDTPEEKEQEKLDKATYKGVTARELKPHELEEDNKTYRKGDKVTIPHKGKMVDGTVVRMDKREGYTDAVVVYVGEYSSLTVPVHKVTSRELEPHGLEECGTLDEDAMTAIDEAMDPKLEELISELAGDLKEMVQQIEARPKTTQNHYGQYMGLLSGMAKNKGHAQIIAAALIEAGANRQGVVSALKLSFNESAEAGMGNASDTERANAKSTAETTFEERIYELAGISEAASGGGTSAGNMAAIPYSVNNGGMISHLDLESYGRKSQKRKKAKKS